MVRLSTGPGYGKRFYAETLGLKIEYSNLRFALLRAKGGAKIALHTGRDTVSEAQPHWFFEFVVDDIDSVCRGLESHGLSFTPVQDEFYGRTTTFLDLEGNKLGIEQPRR